MDNDISIKVSKEWDVSQEIMHEYLSFYNDRIRPIIKSNYLSHLVTTVENMVNDKRMVVVLNALNAESVNKANINRE